jgi:hypothetical protein
VPELFNLDRDVAESGGRLIAKDSEVRERGELPLRVGGVRHDRCESKRRQSQTGHYTASEADVKVNAFSFSGGASVNRALIEPEGRFAILRLHWI